MTFPFPFMHPAGASQAVSSRIFSAISTTGSGGSTSFTYSSVPFGAANGRVIYAAFSGARQGGAPNPTVTFGGAAATRVARAMPTGDWWTDIYKGVPTVSSGSVVYSFSGNGSFHMATCIWSVENVVGEHGPYEYGVFNFNFDHPLAVFPGGVLLAASGAYSSLTPTWTNLNQDAYHRVETHRNFTAASLKTSGESVVNARVRRGTSEGGLNFAAVSIF